MPEAAAVGTISAAAFAVQQLIEIIDPVVSRLIPGLEDTDKKALLGGISLFAGLGMAFGSEGLTLNLGVPGLLDTFITGLVISAGTEGINSVQKFLGYLKEQKKAQAAGDKQQADAALGLVNK